MSGTLILVGVGPGAPDLMTIRAANVVDEVPVIAYVETAEGGTMALDIARRHCNPHAIYLPVVMPMSTDRAPGRAAYDAAAEAIRAHLEAGRDVAWLCEGDPLFYGSAMYLLGRLAARATVRVVPGVTSLTAAAAALPRPLAARDEMLKVLPATLPDAALRPELETEAAVAILKVGRHFDRVRALLEATGRLPGAVLVEHATTGREQVTRLADVSDGARPYFSIILSRAEGTAWL